MSSPVINVYGFSQFPQEILTPLSNYSVTPRKVSPSLTGPSPMNLLNLTNLSDDYGLLDDNMGELSLVDTRKLTHHSMNSIENDINDNLPKKITGKYDDNFNIIYVDEIIQKTLAQENYQLLPKLKKKREDLKLITDRPQNFVSRKKTLHDIDILSAEIKQIESGQKLATYQSKVVNLLAEYNKYNGEIKSITFEDLESKGSDILDENVRHRMSIIDMFFAIASKYITIEVTRNNNHPSDMCSGCDQSLDKVTINNNGTKICPNCQTEHALVILTKQAKDNQRINTTDITEDESIDNFFKAFDRKQCLQTELPAESLYRELDKYFLSKGRPTAAQIKELPLNNRGRRGDTDHKMLWKALEDIGRPEYYEDADLIGREYWAWEIRSIEEYREPIRLKYLKTQKVFYEIPIEERKRYSSLGTQLRLWRHLQLEGHECYKDEFKIGENEDSFRNNTRLWRLMCEGANDPDIYYIP